MTSLIAWIGVDSRGAASAYFASDSRITWPGSQAWDHGRKLFACRRYPDIFGYCGDVLFPVLTLSQISEMIDSDLLLKPSDTVDQRTGQIVSTLKTAFDAYPAAAKAPFEVLYCTRENEGPGCRFHLRQISFTPSVPPKISVIELPGRSDTIAVLGSGSTDLREHINRWHASDVGGTSRAMFSAFCDSLRSGADQQSAGPPQLVGLWRSACGITFGIVWQSRRYFYGIEVLAQRSLDNVRWYNDLFEICDPDSMERRPGAQPQPRPRGL
jgi:hypothetical protein